MQHVEPHTVSQIYIISVKETPEIVWIRDFLCVWTTQEKIAQILNSNGQIPVRGGAEGGLLSKDIRIEEHS